MSHARSYGFDTFFSTRKTLTTNGFFIKSKLFFFSVRGECFQGVIDVAGNVSNHFERFFKITNHFHALLLSITPTHLSLRTSHLSSKPASWDFVFSY
jgi:hypothetical protein